MAETLKEMNLKLGKQMRIRTEIRDMNSRKLVICWNRLLVQRNGFRIEKNDFPKKR